MALVFNSKALAKSNAQYFNTGGILNFGDGNITLTHSAGKLTLAGGQFLIPDGTAAAPSVAFASDLMTGWYRSSAGTLRFSSSGDVRMTLGTFFSYSAGTLTGSSATSAFSIAQTWNTTGVIDGGFRLQFTDTNSGTGSLAEAIYGGAAGTTLLRSTSKAGNIVAGGWVSASASGGLNLNGRSIIRSAVDGNFEFYSNAQTGFTTLNLGPTSGNTARGSQSITNGLVTIDISTATGVGTATITSPTTAIPANSLVDGMTAKIDTILAGAGLTTISIGTAADPDKWGTGIAVAAGTTINLANWTETGPWPFATATSIVITAAAGVLSTGVITLTPHYKTYTPKA